MPNTRQQGSAWESAAEAFLRGKGLVSVARNYHSRFGEIDLVMLDGPVLVFVEVRFRACASHGSGADSVTVTKQRRITSAAHWFLQREKQHARRACRFDVVSIGREDGHAVMQWIRRAFDAG